MRLLPLAPAFAFGLIAVVASALTLRDGRTGNPEAVISRGRLASQVAVVAVVLCVLSLLIGGAIFVASMLPEGR